MQSVELQPYHPKMGNAFTRWFGRSCLKLLGWQISGEFPKQKKVVFCVAPHTSNWDFFIAIFAVLAMGMKASWVGKHQIFIWPIKGLLIKLGGIAVNRKNPKGIIEQIVDAFDEADSMLFGIAPEGTRKRVVDWKNGFLRIAEQANVPVCMAYLDFDKKEFGFGPVIEITDIEQDMNKVREFYKTVAAKHPALTN